MPLKFEVAAVVGQDKNGKSISRKIGAIISTKNGGFMLKIESIPVGWDGWAYLNEPQQKQQPAAPQRQQAPQGGGGGPFDGIDDDIPF